MRKDDFISYVNDPGSLDKETLAELDELLKSFPYFQTAHLLYLKNLYNFGHIRFDTQLKISSLYVADRRKLYELLHEGEEKGKETEVTEETGEKEEKGGAGRRAQSAERMEGMKGTGETEETDEKGEGGDDLFVLDHDAPEGETVGEVDKTGAEQEGAADLLELDLPDKDKEEHGSGTEKGPAKKKTIDVDPSLPAYAFGDWLGYFEMDGGEAQEEKGEKRPEDEIIDRFIRTQPRIVPRKQEEKQEKQESSGVPEPEEVRKSTEEKGLFTETLARIYLQQGYYTKAIHIYEKLSLKYPEKSSYFATQIEKINRILTDQTKKQ